MRIFCTALLAAVLAQDDSDLDFFARGKKSKNKNKNKVPTTTLEPTTTTTTTTTTSTTTAAPSTTKAPTKNYQDPILNEIFNKKEREDDNYEATTAITNAQQNEYNPPSQQISYDGNLNLNEIEIKMMLQPDFKKFCWNCNVGGNNDSDSLKAKCMAEGKYEACSSGNSDCYVTMRKNDGQINMLQSGCKQLAACSAESKQVMGGACRPGADKGPSHCNYCCDYENCNLEFLEVNNYDPAYTAFEQSA